MPPGNNDPFESQLTNEGKFKNDLLSNLDKSRWPDRIDYVAQQVAAGQYSFGMQTANPEFLLDGYDLDRTAGDLYREGIAALSGDETMQTNLPDDFRLGQLLVQFAGLSDGLKHVDRHDVPPGEILSRLVTRSVKRQSQGRQAELAQELRSDAETPRELISELLLAPELANPVQSALPDSDDPSGLTDQLASLDLTTELWDHQLESLALWLHHDMNGYVDMATATGKTVLGLATVAHAVDFGSLHPADQDRLSDIFDGGVPEPKQQRPNDVLIVTTDDLLGVQWARLFQEHCHTPPSYTKLDHGGIQLLENRIDIRSARALNDVNPSDYRLAIFDEVHNYRTSGGWGDHLVRFIDSSCPVLALTGSVTKDFESLVGGSTTSFPLIYRYTHKLALNDGVIPDFEWTLEFSKVKQSDSLRQFTETADKFDQLLEYDAGTYRISSSKLRSTPGTLTDEEVSTLAGEYTSGTAVANGLRDTGEGETAPTDWLESLAHGIGNRTIHRLNLNASLSGVIDIAEEALEDNRPVLVLTQSYTEGQEIARRLDTDAESRLITLLERDDTPAQQDKSIRNFDDAATGKKVLIGPGKRIGQGNDIHSVEVGINISRPGSGVNATLVQRLGRLLRDADSKDSVDFHHVVGVPPEDAVIEPDGEAFVRTVSEFFGQVLEPDTDGILKIPGVGVEPGVGSDIATLETLGAPNISQTGQSTVIESAYSAAIQESDSDGTPIVTGDWFSAAFEAQTVTVGDSDDSETQQTEAISVDTSEQPDETSDTGSNTEEARETSADDASRVPPSPLAEHYDMFWRFCIVQKALLNAHFAELDADDSFRQWATAAKSMVVTEGFETQETGYGKQQQTRSEISISDYRTEYGDGDVVTDAQTTSETAVPATVQVLLQDVDVDFSSWTLPVSPQSNTPLPVIVESEAELERGLDLLREFPPVPPTTVTDAEAGEEGESGDTDSEEVTMETTSGAVAQSNSDIPAVSESDGDGPSDPDHEPEAVPVEEVRGVSNTVAERFRNHGYEWKADLRAASDSELSSIDGVSPQRVTLIRAAIGSAE